MSARNSPASAQLPLNLRWPAQQRFEHFVPGDNTANLDLLNRTAQGQASSWLFVAGAVSSGKTHLLIAACAAAEAAGRRAQYLALARLPMPGGDIIRGLGGSDLLCIDDLQAIAGRRDAEHALFDLYNRCRAEHATLIFAGSAGPAQIGLQLPDLVSRLSSCTQAVLKPLSDDDRREVLRQRAAARGLSLEDAVLDYLFARQSRDLGSLTTLLDRLDRESLAAQRRITLPFLRKLLERDTTAQG
jgi:DnaA family protein